MKRKVVVTMCLAIWVEDVPEENLISDEAWIDEFEKGDENAIMDMADEATTIKVEITETKE